MVYGTVWLNLSGEGFIKPEFLFVADSENYYKIA